MSTMNPATVLPAALAAIVAAAQAGIGRQSSFPGKSLAMLALLGVGFAASAAYAQTVYYSAPFRYSDPSRASLTFSTETEAIAYLAKENADALNANYAPQVEYWIENVFAGHYPSAAQAATAYRWSAAGCYGCSLGQLHWKWYSDRSQYAYLVDIINPDGSVRPHNGVDMWVWPHYAPGAPEFGADHVCEGPFVRQHYDPVQNSGLVATISSSCGTKFIYATAYNYDPDKCNSCPANASGNPINTATGNKFQLESDIPVTGLLSFDRYYNSFPYAPSDHLGPLWSHTYTRSVELLGTRAVITRPGGKRLTFRLVNAVWVPDSDVTATLIQLTQAGQFSGWEYLEIDAREVERYNTSGQLTKISRANGEVADLVYSSGLLSSVTTRDGRWLQFAYDASQRIDHVSSSSGLVVTYQYDPSGRLSGVAYSSAGSKGYVYNEPANTSGANLRNALTGIVDENGVRYATFKYAADGRAISTEHAGGVEKHSLAFGADGSTTETTPDGAAITYGFSLFHGVHRAGRVVEVGATTRTTTITRDANGRPDQVKDATGVVTDYDYDARGRLTQRIDAFNQAATRRTVQTEWDPVFDLPREQRTYNASNVLVSRRVWTYNSRGQVLTDSLVDPAGLLPARTTTYSYCETVGGANPYVCPRIGLLNSVDGPRTDVSDVAKYLYYYDRGCSDMAPACHRPGDVYQVQFPEGLVQEFVEYDDAGRPTCVKDANGVETTYEYSSRGWMTARKVRGTDPASETDDAITILEYWPTGDVKKVILPDGSATQFDYDQAHRLTIVTDSLGNTMVYAPDNAGHRTGEEARDAGGTARFSLTRVYNTLGDLQAVKDAFQLATRFTYDANGAPDLTTDRLGRVTDNTLDALGRLKQVIVNTAGGATDRAVTQFEYNARDQLTAIIDPKGLRTEYSYNNLGDMTQLSSPDTGVTGYQYNAAGDVIRSSDARGKSSTFTYDALGRLTGQQLPTPSQDVAFDFDHYWSAWVNDRPVTDCSSSERFGVGRLGGMTDESGSTRYCYDRWGNLGRKIQAITGGSRLETVTTYDPTGRLANLTYPSGASVTYLRNENGQVSGITIVPASGQPSATLVGAVTYLPFGPLQSIAFGNGRALTKAYDANYAIDKVSDSAATNPLSEDFTLDEGGRVTGLSEKTSSTATANRTYSYDDLDRVTGERNGSTVIESFTYDATGNRLSKTVGAQTVTYAYPATSHRLSAVGNKSRSYDANGNTTLIGSGGQAPGFVYDDRNRMRDYQIGNSIKATYRYNGKGEQVLRIDTTTAANSRQYLYDEAGHLLGEYTTAGVRIQEYVWLDDTLVGIFSAHDGTTFQYVETDNLGTPRAVINPLNNAVVWRWNINDTTFGDHAPLTDPDGNGHGYTLALRYPGQRSDTVSGIIYNYLRDFEPATGRYVESDPLGILAGPSTYAYAENWPIQTSDRLGLFGVRDALGFVPVVGSVLDAKDSFRCGNVGMGLLHIGLALTDLTGAGAIAKGLTVGSFKIGARQALADVYRDGLSMSYQNVRKRLLNRGLVTKSIATHHWFFKQAGGVRDAVLNAPWNLMPDISDRAHYFAHHGNIFQKFVYGTPSWFKVGLTGMASSLSGAGVASSCECR